ncbi:mitochondrial import receptor subunit TOM40 homolog [Echinococcus multilocularis]|uniref:Mitochondrial import receptor subunit TOM40 homolog n=1 Tax=Echinococcus multilocularis TaxID=6211 RepID=A0A068XU37_ECHMU|nr:mitochondrial import receptor subunit TOM40 homolog [Echinococcus multilocularis]
MDSTESAYTSPEAKPYDDGPCAIENIHNKAHDIFPIPFTGIKLLINRGLSPHFQVSHSLTLSSGESAGYRFGATYAGHNKISENEAFPVLMGELQPNGQLQAQIVDQLSPMCRVRYLAQIQKCTMAGQQISMELRREKWQFGFTLINPDLNRGQMMLAADTMRKMSNRFYMGSMFFYHLSSQLPGGQDGVWSLGGKYVSDFWQFAVTARPYQLAFHSSFHLKVNENLQLAAELESNYQQQSNISTIGYQYDLPKSNVTFRAQLDSNWNIAAMLEKRLIPFPLTFTLTALGNSIASKYEAPVFSFTVALS